MAKADELKNEFCTGRSTVRRLRERIAVQSISSSKFYIDHSTQLFWKEFISQKYY